MTTDIPSGQIDNQSQLESPLAGYQDVLVDDPVALVDDPGVLTGSEVTIIGPQKTGANEPVYRPVVKIER